MKKTIPLCAACLMVITFLSAQDNGIRLEKPPGVFQFDSIKPEIILGDSSVDRLKTIRDALSARRTATSFLYSHKADKGTIYLMKPDNMPCLVPDKNLYGAMPNIYPSRTSPGRIPNPIPKTNPPGERP